MHEHRKRHAELTERFEHMRALEWPLTSAGEQPVYNLTRRMLNDAEDYLDAGQTDAAALSLRVAGNALSMIGSLHALATGDI